MYTPDKLPELVKAVNDWLPIQKDTECAFIVFALGPDGKVSCLLLGDLAG